MSNVDATITMIVILALLLTITRVAFPRAFVPVLAHNAIWIFTLGLIGTNLIVYRESTPTAWVTLALGLVCFNVGAWFGSRPDVVSNQVHARTEKRSIVGRGGLITLLFLYLAGYAGYLATIVSRYGLETLVSDPESIRANAEVSYMAAVPMVFRLLLSLGPLLFAIIAFPSGASVRIHLMLRLALLSALSVSMLSLLQRTNLFVAVLLATALWFSTLVLDGSPATEAERARRRRFAGLAAAGAAVMLASFQFIASALGKTGDALIRRSDVSPILAESPLFSLFSYLTAGTPAFLSLTESTNTDWPPIDHTRIIYGDYNPQTWGAALFENLFGILPGGEPWNPVAPFVDVGTITNVYTWFEPLYRDFREPGIAIGAFALGLATSFMYSRRAESPRAYWMASLLLVIVAFAPFVQKVHDTMFVVSFLLVFFATRNAANEAPDRAARTRGRPKAVPATSTARESSTL